MNPTEFVEEIMKTHQQTKFTDDFLSLLLGDFKTNKQKPPTNWRLKKEDVNYRSFQLSNVALKYGEINLWLVVVVIIIVLK